MNCFKIKKVLTKIRGTLGMKTIKLGRKRLIIYLVAMLILACGVTYAALKPDSVSKLFGKQQSESLKNTGDSIVATIDGEKITKKGFDTYKLFLNGGDQSQLSDKQVLDKILDRQVIYNQAIKEGISVSDDEISSSIKSAQESIKAVSSQYESFKEYLSGLNMTENQYWESVKPTYKKALICGKYKNALKEKYIQANNIKNKNSTEIDSEFRDFYAQKVKDLKAKTKVESFIK
jgi:hypothetical protein